MAQAISLVRLGRKDEAAAAVRRILEVSPSSSSGMLADLGGASVDRDLASKVASALEDAGLPQGPASA